MKTNYYFDRSHVNFFPGGLWFHGVNISLFEFELRSGAGGGISGRAKHIKDYYEK